MRSGKRIIKNPENHATEHSDCDVIFYDDSTFENADRQSPILDGRSGRLWSFRAIEVERHLTDWQKRLIGKVRLRFSPDLILADLPIICYIDRATAWILSDRDGYVEDPSLIGSRPDRIGLFLCRGVGFQPTITSILPMSGG